MMRALIIVGWILLTLLAILFVLLLLLLFVRLRLWAEGENGTGRVTLQFGPLRLPLYPTAQTHKKHEKNAQKPEEKPSVTFEKVLTRDSFELAIEILGELKNRLKISVLRVRILLGTGDAAKTGMLLGTIAAATGMLLPFLEKNYVIPDFSVSVDGDFEANSTKWNASFSCTARLISVVLAAWKYRKQIEKLVKQKEAKEYE